MNRNNAGAAELVMMQYADALKDFTPVTLITATPLILVSPPSFAPKTVQELVDYVKANAGKVNYGSPGDGSAGTQQTVGTATTASVVARSQQRNKDDEDDLDLDDECGEACGCGACGG